MENNKELQIPRAMKELDCQINILGNDLLELRKRLELVLVNRPVPESEKTVSPIPPSGTPLVAAIDEEIKKVKDMEVLVRVIFETLEI
jgi:hypothetical protein